MGGGVSPEHTSILQNAATGGNVIGLSLVQQRVGSFLNRVMFLPAKLGILRSASDQFRCG